jgi:hypothetical protein
MISTNINIAIVVSLILINALLIYRYSYRKKKFGIYALGIFIFFATSYLAYYAIPFKNAIDDKEQLHDLEKNTDENSETMSHFSSDINKAENSINYHLKNLDVILRITTIQSLLCIFFCIIGLATVSGRNRYYITLLFIHGFLFCLCCLMEVSDHITN